MPRDLAAACRAFIGGLDVSFVHAEGNSDSHFLTSLFGQAQHLLVRGGELDLGRWQGVFVRRPEEQDRPGRRLPGLRAKSGGERPLDVWLARCCDV